ncbi:hypothetical protein [Anaeromassilibacillus senegalensis]|uniref:hypothetical protein n=1 Tax=Anaeromassilibacillus senegalensis TaxID=1673717 RepID=UPI000680CC46|nr:hypothetical protein [Anaeromassilibacillus senegalensis]
MYVARVDSQILKSEEVHNLLDQYEEKFNERFIAFNYADFDRQGDKPAAQIYKETLQEALEKNTPYHIESKRCSFFDH